ncbi:hypothetical protein TBLA_0B00810 [Henningerozyma blattae CBS 6284]|uniref:RRM domain-containing protein n=1 Tax=Henningerozyma blattae (strain ATCC 34711 / CBS 6284 / DSM 70876 / NBRC 10599 / NRRL Y-10934 / UCD 77-7) TaxID=1071380 RepID=I2GXS2_HENB6|nr:hypothetical protein TBLA_0B00810 [Tetrapisispora blattae CBS 6284]CCH58924.1 hypothetical protein TBLA_0B00810 [Tetrapisispora blattae CBS 6284]
MSKDKETKSQDTELKVDEKQSEKIAQALTDPTKKRKAEDEIEISLESSVPLSKKQKRLLRRGKITLEEINAKYNIDPSSIEEYKKDASKKEGDDKQNDTQDDVKKDVSKYGVWIGNLSFDTTKEELIRLIVAKTKTLEESKQVKDANIIRVKLPLAQNDGKKLKIKGFCYMDFETEAQMESVISLSECQLNGRKLLIKNSKNYEGRPNRDDLVSMSKNPPSRILFVGNLSYDTTDELLRSHFQHCGEIVKIRTATFEDTGKCKGFSFIDFLTEESATKALKDKSCRKIAGRPIRMEYGEDRSKRVVRSVRPKEGFDLPDDYRKENRATRETSTFAKEPSTFKKDNFTKNTYRKNEIGNNNRLKSSIALAKAQRASAAIVPSEGKKTVFD